MAVLKRRRARLWLWLGTVLWLSANPAPVWPQVTDLTVDGGATYMVNSDVNFINAYIGNLSTGTVNQSGFTNTVTGSLYLGYSAGSAGAYNLSGGNLSAGNEIIGNSGSGLFTQNGGSNAVSGSLTLGNLAGSSGTYNLSRGSNTIAGILFLGYNQDSSGAYNLSGGNLTAEFDYIGYFGLGTFNQSGGTNTTTLNLYLGGNSGGSGAYNLSNGSLSASREYIGYHGSGIFTQSGGDNTIVKRDIYSALYLGSYGNGTYNLINGSLTAPSETIGVYGSGVFNQSNGFNKISEDLTIGYGRNSSGVYNLSGGTLSVDSEVIGYGGSGVFTQTGGVHTIAHDLELAVNPSSTSRLALLGGTLSVGGNYIQNAGGNLALGITSLSNYCTINAGGTASLDGTLTPVLLGSRPLANQVFSGILTGAGGLNGTFTLTDPWISPTLYWQPRYNPNSLDLLVERDYNNQGLALNSNLAAVGAMLNGLAEGASGDLGTVLDAVDNLPTSGDVQDAFKQISPEKAGALATLGFAGATFQMRNLATRTTNLRFEMGNFDQSGGLGGLDLNYSRQEGVMLAYNGAGLPGLFSAEKEFRAPEGRWGLFADGGAAFGSQKSTVNQTGYDFTLGGCTVGADYRVADNLLLGLASGYSHTGSGFHGSGGGVTANTVPVNAYGAYFPGRLYAYGSLGYALNLFDLRRGLNFGGISRSAQSSTTGHQFNAYGETGYDFRVRRGILTPTATIAYSRLWVGGFTEHDAGALDLRVGSQTADSLQTGLGGRLTIPFRAGQVKVAPQVYAFYEHEFANGSRGLEARLSQGGSTFSFQTDAAGRNFAVVGASLNLGLKDNLWAQINYNAEVGRDNYTAHFVNAGLRYEF
jgi:outer membrane autotransporter protein